MKMEAVAQAPAYPGGDELHRIAYNLAFRELGLRWQWDAKTYTQLCSLPEEKDRIRRYVVEHQSHLLAAYEANFLSNLIYDRKTRYFQEVRNRNA